MTTRVLTSLTLCILLSPLLIPAAPPDHIRLLRWQKSQEILKYLNPSIDPCDDFYEYACGNYGKYVQDMLANGYGRWSVLNNVTHSIDLKFLNILESRPEPKDTEADKKVKSFYKACTKEATNTGQQGERLKGFLREFGTMPILEGEQWREEDFNWLQVIANIKHKTDMGIILNPRIMPDFRDNSHNRVALLQPEFTYSKLAYYTDKEFEIYQRIMNKDIKHDLIYFLGVAEAKAEDTALEIFQFEVNLARAMQDNELTPPEELYALMDIEQMQEKYLKAWDSKQLFQLSLGIDHQLKVMLQPKYLQNVFEVMQKTPRRVIANYIFYTYLREYTRFLHSEDPSQTTENCQQLTKRYFEDILQNMVYRKHFTGHEKRIIDILWPEVKRTFEDIMKSPQLNWLDHGQTREKALEKLQAMKLKLDTYEDINFPQKFQDLHIDDHDVLQNIREILKLRGSQAKQLLHQPPQFKVPPYFSPSYTIEENVIHLPISLLQMETPWSLPLPFAINFATLGFYIAHEMIHGFEDSGRYYDATGSSRSWWHSQAVSEFDKRLQCLAQQYRSYSYGKQRLPKLIRQLENIADNGGLHVAYEAYQRWWLEYITDEYAAWDLLADVPFSKNQLFFIAYSQAWCTGISPEYTYNFDSQSVHVPEKLRIIGTLSNSEQFAEAFQCRPGRAMNPERKCKMY